MSMILPPLFWRDAYIEAQSQTAFFAGISYEGCYLESRTATSLRTWIVVDANASGLRSPSRSTFGGFWTEVLSTFEADCLTILTELTNFHPEFALLHIYLPPVFADPFGVVSQHDLLKSLGATLEFTDIDFWIHVPDWSEKSMSKGNRKKLRQWVEAGGVVTDVEMEYFDDVYQVILENRLSLGVTPSISAVDLKRLLLQFPNEYKMHVGSVNGEIAVVAITVLVHSNIKYVFFWADKLEHRHLSPVVAMCAYLISACLREKIGFLDLGISTEKGTENLGLMRFKSNLGAVPSSKYQLVIDFNHLSSRPKR